MMRGDSNSPLIFSGETNPYMRQAAADGDSINIFGKKINKNKALNVLKQLSGGIGSEDEESEDGISQSLIPGGKSAKMPKYNPKDLYGGFFSMYGGQKVRGGLLGD